MVSFKFLLVAASAITGALAIPFDFLDERDDNYTSVLEARQVTGNSDGGKGWNPGTGRLQPFTDHSSQVIENYGTYNPTSNAQHKGTIYTDGDTYDLYMSTRYQQPSIDGTQNFNQYWSIRRKKRVGGSINMQNHFNAWSQAGISLGNHYYQIVATEGYQSSGSSSIYVQIK
ncbi:hypothetical protein ACHAQD_009235 [Fusarium lateritium]